MLVNPPEFSHHLVRSRDVAFSSTCRLLKSTSSLFFDFGEYGSISKCRVRLRRVDGQGKIIVKSAGKSELLTVVSKRSEYIDITTSGRFSIERPPDGNGVIEIFCVELETQNDQTSMKNWKRTLAGCSKYSGIKISNGRLFASEGGSLTADRVERIETNPPGMYKIVDDGVRFLGTCEILSLSVSGASASSVVDFPHIAPAADIVLLRTDEAPVPTRALVPLQKRLPDIPENTVSNKIIYNSNSSGMFRGVHASGNVTISPDASFVRLGHHGEISIPVAAIVPNATYILSIKAQKVNGNGKLAAHISPPMTDTEALVFTTPQPRNLNMAVSSGPMSLDSTFKVVVKRPASSTGDVIIKEIMLMESLDFTPSPSQYVSRLAPANNLPLSVLASSSAIPEGLDNINGKSLKYARFNHVSKTSRRFDLSGAIVASSFGGRQWLSKVSAFFPKIKLSSETADDSTVAMEPLGNLKCYKRILVEEFTGSEINAHDQDVLANADVIFSTSRVNAELLLSKFGKKVRLWQRRWPFVDPKPLRHIGGDYILMANRDQRSTRRFLESYSEDAPKIVLLGARGRYPRFVMPTNEYLPYEHLLHLVMHARAIVDIPTMNNYQSAFQHLATTCGVPVLTSNWSAMELSNSRFLVTRKEAGTMLPTLDAMKEGLRAVLEMQHGSNEMGDDYNSGLLSSVSSLFG